ncbi:uncharacterized protein LOC111699877 [Eurytemora carolleeae]|uniref:uncharacterized protein LOC111699877 n=1 Tax=Eurytemora carolleeae TaxID=1294199 RepID=UPI000C77E915|nr:uncharacterized protein LOC111699877 [Eurytemora carolleeae]|eukprot:XP_023326401.1 uncharacterized protein LOC111699877 [Eurytemora affinis]
MLILVLLLGQGVLTSNVQYPQGYYPFQESPARIPPVVRKPPYLQTQVKCPGADGSKVEQTLDNLCGDLNKGYLPVNPIGQNILGVSYPFELIKNKTLDFFSKTLPVLKADDTLPKVARYQDSHILYNPAIFNSQPTPNLEFSEERFRRHTENQESEDRRRVRRSLDILTRQKRALGSGIDKEQEQDQQEELDQEHQEHKEQDELNQKHKEQDGLNQVHKEQHKLNQGHEEQEQLEQEQVGSRDIFNGVGRQGRAGWCDNSFGVFCMLFNVLKGDKKDEADDRIDDSDLKDSASMINSLEEPMTPCPSAVEYVTPVFAKNYQGGWRYVVQIPYEGYFTQTVEVVKCLSTKCEFLEGSCLASPRWVSLLVSEIYYPDAYFPSGEQPIPGRSPIDGEPPKDYNQYLQKRAGFVGAETENCDGYDELGCFHVRLYYDWFLIPGSCKCWKNDFFAKYTR